MIKVQAFGQKLKVKTRNDQSAGFWAKIETLHKKSTNFEKLYY